MTLMCNWIVFQTPDGEVDAVRIDFDNNLQCMDLINDGNKILGLPVHKCKADAINHIEELIN